LILKDFLSYGQIGSFRRDLIVTCIKDGEFSAGTDLVRQNRQA